MTYDLVIHNGTILTENKIDEVIESGLIGIKDDRIVTIQRRSADLPLPPAVEVIDAGGGLILPGLVNTHTHLPMTLFRGLADDLPLMAWLNEHIFPAESRHIHPQTVRIGALLGAAEMLLSGTTTCCDGYFYEDIVAESVASSGIRAVLGQGVIDFPAPGVPDPSHNIQTAADFINDWKDRHAMITPSVFCHSPYTCTAPTLTAAKQLSAETGVLFQIHVAETQNEVNQSLSEHGMSPVAYLHHLGLLDKNSLLAHCVHLTDEDVEMMAAADARISHNPESNMKLASGVAPVPSLLAAGLTVGLGTDGCASNNDLDLFGEMDITAKLHKVMGHDATLLDVRQVVKMATIEGARAIGLGDVTGSLEVGKQADIIIVDTHRPHLTPMYNPWSHLVYAARGSDVTHTLVAGKVVVCDGCLSAWDVDTVLAAAQKISLEIGKK